MKTEQDRKPISPVYFDEPKSLEELRAETFFRQHKPNKDGTVSLEEFTPIRPIQDFQQLTARRLK